MAFFNIFNKKETPKAPAMVVNAKFGCEMESLISGSFEPYYSDIYKSSRGYLYGENGLRGFEYNRLYQQSPLHSSIINFKKLLTSGKGYDIIGCEILDANNKVSLHQLTNQIDEILADITMDYFVHSKVCIKVTWNSTHTKILKLDRIEPNKINISELDAEMKPISFLYNWDWAHNTKYTTIKYPAFDPSKKETVQLLYVQTNSPGQLLYANPSYQSAIDWINVDASMAVYHNANLEQSINPSMIIQYYQLPGSPEEKQAVLNDINQSLAGKRKTGRAMVNFSDGKELAPTITQAQPNQLDKTFIQLTDTIQRQICYAHGVDPQLLGLKTPGSLGNNGSFLYSYNLFNNSAIQPAQLIIEKIFNKFLTTNSLGVKFKLKDVEIEKLDPALMVAPTAKFEEEMTSEEAEKFQVNEHVKSLTSKQHQQLLRIIRQYGKDQITFEAASVLLRTGLGFSEEDINALLGEI